MNDQSQARNKKLFNHTLVDFQEMETETIGGKRHYVTPEGDRLKSVTSILSEALDNSALLRWKARVGEEEASKVSTQAARRGTAVHNIAERYVLNQNDIFKGEMPFNVGSFQPIKKILDEHVNNVLGVEIPLYDTTLGCAGRTDLVAEYNGVASIIDYKTSKKIKPEAWIESYFLQSTIYSMMFQKTFGIEIPQIAIIITVDHEPDAQIFVRNRSQYVKKCLDILIKK